MRNKILYVGLDVDDNAFHGCALIGDSGEVVEFKSRPHVDGLTKKLAKYSPFCQLSHIHQLKTPLVPAAASR